MKVIHDVEALGTLWPELSPNDSVFQLWSFRKNWISGFKYPLHAILHEDGKHRGILPLWHNTDDKKYEFIGGDWPEDEVFFSTSLDVTKKIIAAAPRPLELCALIPFDGMTDLTKFGTITEDEYLKYVLKRDPSKSFDDLLAGFSKKYRYNLRYDYKRIMEQNPEIIWEDTKNPNHFDEYVKMKDIVFNEDGKDENYYLDTRRKETFRKIIQNSGEYKTRVLQITIDGKLAGIDIVILYKDSYYMIGGAYDTKNFSGVGNAALYLLFEDAVRHKSTLIDCLQEDSGWKHRYFEGRPLYVFSAA